MWLIRPKFGQRYNVCSDISVDGAGIHDGLMVLPWHDIEACTINESDKEMLERYFGDSYDERPFSIFITRKDGSRNSIMLFGQDLESAIKTGLAINHYSGRTFISKEWIDGKPIPPYVFGGIALLAALLTVAALL